MENIMNRRSFLMAGAAAAVGGIAIASNASQAGAQEENSYQSSVNIPEKWDREVDVVVVGSGSIIPAALKAYEEGLEVLVLEKSPTHFGGTSYFAGGGCACPNSTLALESGQAEIPRELCKQYMEETACGQSNDAIMEGMLDNYVPAIDFLLEIGIPVTYYNMPDAAFALYTPNSCLEEEYGGVMGHVFIEPYGDLTAGRAWMNYFKDALDERNIEVMMGTAGKQLIYSGNPLLENGEVIGIYAETNEGTIAIKARRAVILGTGGFDHNKEMVDHYLAGPMYATVAVPTNTGDGHIMAMEVGADLRNMREAFSNTFAPTEEVMEYAITHIEADEGVIRSEQKTGCQLSTIGSPGCIAVNKHGERFANEASSYDLFPKGFQTYDSGTNEWRNIPGYVIADSTYAIRNVTTKPLGVMIEEGEEIPSFIKQYDTLEELAADKGINVENLLATVERFNGFCETGIDEDWHRGENSFDRNTCGKKERVESGELINPCLAPLAEGPFFCYEIYPGMMQTKGGLVVNEHAQVLNTKGNVIPRLYAGSNTIANPTGRGYGWGGATIANGYIVGYMAADHAATLTAWDQEA